MIRFIINTQSKKMIKIIEIRLDYKDKQLFFFPGNICGNNVLSFKPTEADSPSMNKYNFSFFSSTGDGFLASQFFFFFFLN